MSLNETITLTYYNDVYMKIDTSDYGIMQEIHDYFTFKVPNYQFHPKYKLKIWDGNIRLFNTRNGLLYAGLKEQMIEFARSRDYKIVIDKIMSPDLIMNTQDVFDYIKKDLNPHIIEKKTKSIVEITPYDYQVQAVKTVLENERRLLLAATSSGKSLIIYTLARLFTDKRQFFEESGNKKVLIVVPTTSLVEQMHSDFDEYAIKDDKWFSENEVHKIYQGMDKNTKKEIIVSTWQSIYKMPKDYFNQFGMVIVDEAHTAKADCIKGIMEKLVSCPLKIGMTGTLDGTTTNKLVLEGLFGRVERIVTAKEMMDDGQASQLEIFGLVLNWAERNRQELKKAKFQDEIDWLYSSEKRNTFIANLALKQKQNTLVLFNYVEKHGVPLHKLICDKNTDKNRKIYFISRKTPVIERERIRKEVESEDNAIIVASYGTFSTGINIKRIMNIIFASSYKAQIKVLQSIGRGLRKADDKEKITLYDITDDLCVGSKKNYTLLHFFERIKIYDKEQFKYKLIKIDIETD